jgi:hypothetical protein
MSTYHLAAASIGLGLTAFASPPASAGPLIGSPHLGKETAPHVHLAQRRDGRAERRVVVRPDFRPGRVVVRPGFAPVRPGRVVVTRGWRRPGNYWWRPGGAVAAGAAVGFLGAAAVASFAGAPPAPGYCWYYTDPSYTQGFWDACP